MTRPGSLLQRLRHPRVPAWLHLHLDRLARAPRVAAISPVRPARTTVTIDGMVCGVCAARTRTALRSVPGVRDARVDLAAGTAELDLVDETAPDAGALQRALDGVVVGKPARRWLEAVSRRAERATHRGGRTRRGR